MPTLSSRLSRVAAPLTLLRLVGQGSEFVAFVILARRLGTTDFGLVAVGYLVCRYAGLIADWGATLQGPRDVAAGRPARAIRALVRRRTLATAALVVAFGLGTVLVGHPALAPMGLTIAGRGLNRDWISLGQERGVRAGLPAASQGLVAVVLCTLATTTGAAAWALAAAWSAGAALSVLLNPLPRADDDLGAEPIRVDPWFMVLILADQFYATADVILISVLLSASDAGIYAAVYRFPNALITIIGLVVASLIPGITRAVVVHGSDLARLRRKALRVGAWCAAGVLASIPVAWALVPVVFGQAYEPGRGPMVLLLVATAFPAFTIGLQPLYFSSHPERPLAFFAVLTAAVNVGGNLVAIPVLGLDGAAAVTLLSQAMIGAFYVTRAGRGARP